MAADIALLPMLKTPGEASLRMRLLWAVLGSVAVVCLLLTVVINFTIIRTTDTELDQKLVRQARVILAYAEHEFAETGSVVPEPVADPGPLQQPEVVYQLWRLDGTPIHRSQGAPATPLIPLSRDGGATALIPVSRDGVQEMQLHGAAWRAYSLRSHVLPIVLQIAEPRAERQLLASRLRAAIGTPIALAFPVFGVLVWWLTTLALRRLKSLERQIGARSATSMTPIDLAGMPGEIISLGRALNALILRHRHALEREHRFTTDAAHELRTPLAAIRAQAQVALRSTQATERLHALEQLIIGVDRSSRLITQLLAFARLEPGLRPEQGECRGIDRVLADVIHDLDGDIRRRSIEVIIDSRSTTVLAAEEPIYFVLRNLIENAVHHSPLHAKVAINMTETEEHLELSISDSGPGIPMERREAVFDRFRRFSSGYHGTGLGLSIVKRAVELLDGTISLQDAVPGPGLNAVVALKLDRHRHTPVFTDSAS